MAWRRGQSLVPIVIVLSIISAPWVARSVALLSAFGIALAFLAVHWLVSVNSLVATRSLRPLAITTPSAWSAVQTRASWEIGRTTSPTLHSTRLDRLLELVIQHFIQPWYGRISPSLGFTISVDTLCRHLCSRIIERGQHNDWSFVLVSRIVPLLKTHLVLFRNMDRVPSAKLHPALASHDSSSRIELHLRSQLGKLTDVLLPGSPVARTMCREVLLGVALPVFHMLSDKDFWNRQIDARTEKYLQEQKQVTRFLSALSTLNDPQTPVKRKQTPINVHSSANDFDAFIRSIDRIRSLGDARRVRSDIDRELRHATEAGTERHIKYLKRLGRAKRHVESKLNVLGQVTAPTAAVQDVRLISVLSDPSSLAYWLEFMERRGRSRLVQFWLAIEGFKDPLEGDSEGAADLVRDIDHLRLVYFGRESPLDLPLLHVQELTSDAKTPAVARDRLVRAQRAAFESMYDNDWDDFRHSELFRKAVQDLVRVEDTPISEITPGRGADVVVVGRTNTAAHLDTLFGTDRSTLFVEDNEDLDRMDAIQTALDDIIGDDEPPQAMFRSVQIERPKRSISSRSLDGLTKASAERTREVDGQQSGLVELDRRLQDLLEQESLLSRLVEQAEFTNNDAELRLLHRTLSSIKVQIRSLRFQRTQLERQTEENRFSSIRTHVTIPNAVLTDDEGKTVAKYAVRVQQLDESVSASWVVYRRYNEFYELDKSLRESGIVDIRRLGDLPSKKLGPSTSSSLVETRRSGLERYLQSLVRLPDVCESSLFQAFMSRLHDGPARSTSLVQSLVNTVTNSFEDTPMLDMIQSTLSRQLSEVAEGFGGVVGFGGEVLGQRSVSRVEPGMTLEEEAGNTKFTAPICDLLVEVFDLEDSGWIRRQAFVVILQQILDSTIERRVRDWVQSIPTRTEEWLGNLQDMIFPGGERRPPSVERSEAEISDTQQRASRQLGSLIPDLAANMIGRSNARRGARRVFGVLQEERLNQHLILCLLDEIVDLLTRLN